VVEEEADESLAESGEEALGTATAVSEAFPAGASMAVADAAANQNEKSSIAV